MVVPGDKAVHGWDIIVFKLLMQREVLEAMPIAKAMGQKIVVDVDDWFDGLAETNRAHQTTDPQNNPNNNREIYAQIIMQADAVITSTPFLFDYYAAKRNNVFLVRNGIDIERWKPRIPRLNHRIKLGWVGATPWRSGDLETLSPFIGNYLTSRKIGFHHSGHTENGAPRANRQLGIPDNISKTSPLVPIMSYPRLFEPIDIGIVPLSNIQFNHAKSYIKGLEYAAAGVPFVSPYSPEYKILADQGIGRIAYTDEDWVYHLDELRQTYIRRDEIAHNLEVLQNFTMAKRGDDWDATMRFILEKI
jgi:glycosyltransferase involved in cell wall biosynthesis